MNEPCLTEKQIRQKLLFVNDGQPGIRRKRRGRGFIYLDAKGKKIESPRSLKRIKSLVIPPQWKDVWICKSPKGYIQATGRDDRNRKQYIYHPLFVEYRQQYKFQRMVSFARKLPEIRKKTEEHLRQRKWPREKVLALIVRVLDHCGIRIGNREYAQTNNSYGLTTLRRKHMTLENNGILFSYKGKSGKPRDLKLEDPQLVRLIKKCSELPGYEVFRYINEDGQSKPVDSEEVNEYIRSIAGEEFSSKDFRTWTATTLAVYYYPEVKSEIEANPNRSPEAALANKVAKDLGNTTAVCRRYYIHPKVLQAAAEEKIPVITSANETENGDLDPWEKAALDMLSE